MPLHISQGKKTKGNLVMGMAASQARFLGLTARKTNVEYEGQQINQQRTTLANETANYYNDLLGMQVPVPPSVADYTKTVYTFKDGSLTNSITSMIAKEDGMYMISYVASWIDDFAAVSAPTSIVTRLNGIMALVGDDTNPMFKRIDLGTTPPTYDYNVWDGTGGYVPITWTPINDTTVPTAAELGVPAGDYYMYTDPATGDVSYISRESVENAEYDDTTGNSINTKFPAFSTGYGYNVGAKRLRPISTGATIEDLKAFREQFNDEYLNTLSDDQLEQLLNEENEYLAILMNQYGGGPEDWAVRYVQNTSTGVWSPYFTKLTDLNSEDTVYQDTGASLSYIPMYTIGSAKKNEEVKNIMARFEADATGRLIAVTLHPDQEDQVTYAVETNSVTDQAKYDDAMNQYEYDKYQYDQTIQEINAKIEIIQAQDKNLELRLKQLDTEQEAIQTEMDAVQKVIEKNTESTFKTFG